MEAWRRKEVLMLGGGYIPTPKPCGISSNFALFYYLYLFALFLIWLAARLNKAFDPILFRHYDFVSLRYSSYFYGAIGLISFLINDLHFFVFITFSFILWMKFLIVVFIWYSLTKISFFTNIPSSPYSTPSSVSRTSSESSSPWIFFAEVYAESDSSLTSEPHGFSFSLLKDLTVDLRPVFYVVAWVCEKFCLFNGGLTNSSEILGKSFLKHVFYFLASSKTSLMLS